MNDTLYTPPTVERLWIRIAQYLSYVLPYDEFVPSRATKLELAGLWYQHGKKALDAVPDRLRNDPAYIELRKPEAMREQC